MIVEKLSRVVETDIVRLILRDPVSNVSLAHVSPRDVCEFRDRRLATVKPATVCRELCVLQHAFNVAKREWGLPISSNPVAATRKPKIENRRDRRLRDNEYEALLDACSRCRNHLIRPIITVALETGMRRGELLSAEWRYLDIEHRTLHLPHTKNGFARTVPLSPSALTALQGLDTDHEGRIFPMSKVALKQAWGRLKRRAGVTDLRFHDFRHEAISRFFEMGLSLPEVASISGHRDPRMLLRYTHFEAATIARKLGGL